MIRQAGGFSVDTYTQAPLRLSHAAFLDAPPRRVFTTLTDHTHLARWLPFIRQVNVNRGHATVRDGEGTIRYLDAGVLTVREYVVAYDAPRLMAHTVEHNPLICDHISVLLLMPERYGGTFLYWRHYFNTSVLSSLTVPVVTLGLRVMYGRGLHNLIARYGGRMLPQNEAP